MVSYLDEISSYPTELSIFKLLFPKEDFSNPIMHSKIDVTSADKDKRFGDEALSSGPVELFVSRDLNVVCKQDKMNGETNSAGGSNETRTSTNKSDGGNSQGRAPRKVKLRWKNELQHKFLEAIEHLGLRKAMPKTIQEFMNVKGVTRTHIASHLQKYRRHLKRLNQKARKAEMARHNRHYYTNFTSSSFFSPHGSYKNTQLNMDNLFQSQLGYGLGQSSLILNKYASTNYMQHGRPINDLYQTRSNLLPMGGSRGYSSGVLPLNNEMRSFLPTPQVSRVSGLGLYGTPNGSLGMNSNQGTGTGYMRSNYAGISVDANGNLTGVDGNGYGSLGESLAAMNLNFNNNNMSNQGISTSRVPSTFGTSLANGGQTHSSLLAQMDCGVRRSILGTSQASQLVPPFGQYGTRNDVYNAGINTHEYGDLNGLGGARVNSNVNGSLGESVGTMNRDFNNNNMTNHGSSTSRLSSPLKFFANEDRSQSNLDAQLDGLVPILENLSMCSDGNTVNAQFDQNQHKGQVSAGNSKLSNDVPEGNATSSSESDNYQGEVSAGNHEVLSNNVLLQKYINNWSFNNHQDQVSAGNPAMFNNVLLEGNAINNWSFNNHQGQVSAENFELSNGILLERNAINNWSFNNHQSQVNVGHYELANDVLLEGNAFSNGSFDNEQVWDEQTLNSIAASSEMSIPSPTPDIISTINLEQGVAVLAEVPLPPIDLDWNEGDLSNFMIDIDDLF